MISTANAIVSEIAGSIPMKAKKERKQKKPKEATEPKQRGRKPVPKNIVYSVKCIDKELDPKIYLGSTCNSLNVRRLIHLNCIKKGYESNDLYINMRKNGVDKYEFNIEHIVKPNAEGMITKEDLKKEEDRISNEYKAKGISLYNIRRAHDDSKPETASSKWRKANSNRYKCEHCGICTSDRIQMINHLQSRKHFKLATVACKGSKELALKDIEKKIYAMADNDPKDMNVLISSVIEQLYKLNQVAYKPIKPASDTESEKENEKEVKVKKLNVNFQVKALLIGMLKQKRAVMAIMKQQQALRFP